MKYRIQKLLQAQILNFFLILILHLLFFLFIDKNSYISEIFLLFSGISNAFIFSLVLLLINFPVALASKRLSVILLFLTNILLLIFLVVDFGIFRIYGFHFNGMVVGMITTPGFWDSVSLGFSAILLFSVFILGLILVEIILLRYSYNKNFKFIALIYTLLIIIAITEHVAYAISDIYNIQEVTKYTKVYPLYQPLTIRGFAKKVLKMDINKEKELKIAKSSLEYPKNKIEVVPKVNNLKNIIVIAIDSIRFDMINDEVSPNLNQIRKKSYDFKNHYSGGNSTRFGIFSLFYGLYGYYWHDFLNDRKGTVFIDVLKKLGYKFKILSATALTFPEFRKTVFIDIPDAIEDTFDTEDRPLREKLLVDRFRVFRDNLKGDNPYFAFLFFDAPHSRQYPDKFRKFKTSGKEANYFLVGKKNITDIKNAYLNAVYYDDYLVGKLYDYLNKIGDLKNTIIIITGDHGEEFYEQGHFGHNNSFGKYQTKVPFIVYMPGQGYKNIDILTSHYDFVPTILDFVGVKNPHTDYSFGTNLFNPAKRDYVVSCNWSNCGIIDNESVLYFSYETHKSLNMTLYDQNYNEVTDRDFINKKKQRLYSLIKEFSYFYKH